MPQHRGFTIFSGETSTKEKGTVAIRGKITVAAFSSHIEPTKSAEEAVRREIDCLLSPCKIRKVKFLN